VYGTWAPLVVRTVKGIQGGRGMSGLSPEPSALATVALTHILLTFYYRKYRKTPDREFWYLLGMSTLVLLLSRSATGFVFLLIMIGIAIGFMAFNGMSAVRWGLLVVSVGVMVGLLFGPLAESRGGAIIVTFVRDPGKAVSDGSLQERERCLTVGILSLLHYPLGAGGGTFPDVALDMQKRYPINRVFDVAAPGGIVGVLNAGGLYLVEMGIVYLLFVAIILMASLRVEVIHLMSLWLAFMFLMIAGSVTSPLTWLLLGLTATTHKARHVLRPARAA
jgi:hypothetical protein